MYFWLQVVNQQQSQQRAYSHSGPADVTSNHWIAVNVFGFEVTMPATSSHWAGGPSCWPSVHHQSGCHCQI